MKEERKHRAQLSLDKYKAQKLRVIQSAKQDKFLSRRKSMQNLEPKSSEIADEIRRRMEEKKQQKEQERIETKKLTNKFLAKAKILNEFKYDTKEKKFIVPPKRMSPKRKSI